MPSRPSATTHICSMADSRNRPADAQRHFGDRDLVSARDHGVGQFGRLGQRFENRVAIGRCSGTECAASRAGTSGAAPRHRREAARSAGRACRSRPAVPECGSTPPRNTGCARTYRASSRAVADPLQRSRRAGSGERRSRKCSNALYPRCKSASRERGGQVRAHAVPARGPRCWRGRWARRGILRSAREWTTRS